MLQKKEKVKKLTVNYQLIKTQGINTCVSAHQSNKMIRK